MQKLPDAASLTPEELVERWKLWMKETQADAFRLYASRFKFENIQRMFSTNPALNTEGGGSLYEWLLRNFYTEYLITIRREMDTGSGFMTLVNFLRELETYAETVLTRKRFVALYSQGLRELGIADKDFDERVGATGRYPRSSPDDDYISADSIRRTRLQLEKDVKRVLNYANWFVAHRTRKKPFKLTLADMYKAMNRIFDVYARYYWIITGSTWASKFPEPQYDWRQPYTIPWISKDFKPFEPPT
jgi:hypothetical protein